MRKLGGDLEGYGKGGGWEPDLIGAHRLGGKKALRGKEVAISRFHFSMNWTT